MTLFGAVFTILAMTEKYLGSRSTIYAQELQAAKDTFLGEYTIYNSSIENYSFALTVPGREPPFERIARVKKGVVLDIGCSVQMLDTLQSLYADVHTVGIGVWLSEYEKAAAKSHQINLIEGSIFHPPETLQAYEGRCHVIVSKHTFTQFKDVNPFLALQYVWDLLSYHPDPSLTGAAYIHMGLPPLTDSFGKYRKFAELCSTMTNGGFDIYSWEKQYQNSVVIMTKNTEKPLRFSVSQKLDEFYWNSNGNGSSVSDIS